MKVIDDGDYQGTQIFITPLNTYQPSVEQYVYTNTYYGSCSGCDTLLGIIDFFSSKEIGESEIKDLMQLALHLLQKMKWLEDTDEEDEDEEFEQIEKEIERKMKEIDIVKIEEIDIDKIEELGKILYIGNNAENVKVVFNNIIDKQNEILKAVKQLNRKG